MAPIRRRGKSLSTVKSILITNQCLICSNAYRDYKTLEYHTNLHTGENPYECKNCNAAFPYINKLHRHRDLVHSKKRLQCNICSASYGCNRDLQNHMDSVHYGKKYICGGCSTQYSSHATLTRHRDGGYCNGVKKMLKSVKLRKLQKNISNKVALTKNVKVMKNRKLTKSREPDDSTRIAKCKRRSSNDPFSKNQLPHQCVFCSKFYSGYHALEYHINLHTGEHPYQCNECGASFPDHRYLGTHMNLKHQRKTYPCDMCSDVFKESVYLRRHKDQVHYGKEYICEGCGTKYYDQFTLKRHRDRGSCSGVKKVRRVKKINGMIQDGKIIAKRPEMVVKKTTKNKFKNLFYLPKTQMLSSEMTPISSKSEIRDTGNGKLFERPAQVKSIKQEVYWKSAATTKTVYKCSQCPTTHLDRNLLLRHAADCHNRKIFECPICQNLYTEHCNMTRHIKSSHGNDKIDAVMEKRNTNCDKCNLKFASYRLLWNHKKKKHNLKLFKCPYCSNEYTAYSNMWRHKKSHVQGHKNQIGRLPKVYETESAKKKKTQIACLPENAKRENKLDDFPVIKNQNFKENSSYGNQAHQKIIEIVNKLRISRE